MDVDGSAARIMSAMLFLLPSLCGIAGCGAFASVESASDNQFSTTTTPDAPSSEFDDGDELVATPPDDASAENDDGGESATTTTLDDLAAQFEEEVLGLVNEQRSSGASCGIAGDFDPTHPLTMNSDLRVAARSHSLDMASRDFFDHANPDGDGPGERIAATGYSAANWGENIAWGQTTPEQVVASWMSSSGHCANIMRSSFRETGIGYDPTSIWTQVFAAPAAR